MKPQRINIGSVTPESLRLWMQNHSRVLAGQVSFGATMGNIEQDRNIQCSKASGTTPGVANTEFAVAHSLGRVPITLAGWDTDNGGVIYRSTTAWTSTTAYFKCTSTSAAYNMVLI